MKKLSAIIAAVLISLAVSIPVYAEPSGTVSEGVYEILRFQMFRIQCYAINLLIKLHKGKYARDLTAWKDSNPATSYSQVFSNMNYDK